MRDFLWEEIAGPICEDHEHQNSSFNRLVDAKKDRLGVTIGKSPWFSREESLISGAEGRNSQ